jgi:hypothetical protein
MWQCLIPACAVTHFELGNGEWFAEPKALQQTAATRNQEVTLFACSNALSHHVQFERAGQGQNRVDDRAGMGSAWQVLDEATMHVGLNGGDGGRDRVNARQCPLLPGQGSMTLAWYVEWYWLGSVIEIAK